MKRLDLKVGVIIFGLLCAGTIFLEIKWSGGETIQTETTLFGVLQFVFSVAFAWFLARSASEREFQMRQKTFAISAYRRIREITRSAERLLRRASRDTGDISEDLRHELEVIREISIGIRDTAGSSIADWANLIGEEISTLERIEDLRSQESEEPNRSGMTNERGAGQEGTNSSRNEDDAISDIVKRFAEELPPALRVEVSKDRFRDSSYFKKKQRFQESMRKNGYVELKGFWEPDKGFSDSIKNLSAGDDAKASVGDADHRIMCLLLLDQDGNKVGVLTNDTLRWGGGSYTDFARAVTSSVGSSCFPVFVSEIEPQSKKSSRTYFTVRVLPDTIRSAQARNTRANQSTLSER